MSPRRPRGEDEEDLLFRDGGYGMDGSFLPGLSGGMPLPGLGSGPQHPFPPGIMLEDLSHKESTSK